MLLRGIFTIFLILGCSCENRKDSPFSDETAHAERDLNLRYIDSASSLPSGPLNIAVFTDVHQNYGDFDLVVDSINSTDAVDLVFNLGDLTNQGYNFEYDQFLTSYLKLIPPSFSVIGNHDSLGSGVAIFERIFGPLNYIFETSEWRFIFFNSANWENPDGFDPQWLVDAVNESGKDTVILSHVSLTERHRFGDTVSDIFDTVIANPKVKLVVNGHGHKYFLQTRHGTILLEAPRVEGRQWLLLNLEKLRVRVQKLPSGESAWFPLKESL
jgi:predicted phosphodiesterase